MARFNIEGYRKEAKEAGLDDKEIEQVIKEETSGFHPDEPKIDNPAGTYDYIKPAAIAVATGVGLKMAKHAYDKYLSIKNEGIPKTESEKLSERIEPLLDTNQQKPTGRVEPTLLPEGPVAPTSTGPVALPNAQAPNPATLTSSPQEMANFATGAVAPPSPGTQPVQPTQPVQVAPSAQPPQPAPTTPAQQALKTELTPPVNNNPTSPIASVQPNPVTSGEGASPLHNPQGQGLTQTEATNVSATPNSAFPAETNAPKESGSLTNKAENPTQGGVEKVEKEIKGAAKPRLDKELILKDTPEQWTKLSKEGQTFLPGYGAGDNNLYNTYGAEGRKAILEKYNNGKPIGSYKNYEDLNQKLKAGVPIGDVPDLMSKLPAEEEAGNYGKLGRKGLVKATGVGGLLVTAAQLSHAAEQAKKGNYAPARESLFDLVSALGGVGGMAATHMGGLNKDEEKQLAQRRYAYEMSKKNGAGRGQLNSTK